MDDRASAATPPAHPFPSVTAAVLSPGCDERPGGCEERAVRRAGCFLVAGLARSGGVAQLGERRLCKPQVVGSSPIASTRRASSSVGQSARLISVRSEVQVFPGPPARACRGSWFRDGSEMMPRW